ncbi:hypothetical protein Tco_1511943 [Tanacetum coccineum]
MVKLLFRVLDCVAWENSRHSIIDSLQESVNFVGHLALEFDIEIRDKEGAKNLAANHLSRLEIPYLGKLTKVKIRDLYLEEQLMTISDKSNEPCNAQTKSYDDVSPKAKLPKFFDNVIVVRQEDILGSPPRQEKSLKPGSTGLTSSVMHIN